MYSHLHERTSIQTDHDGRQSGRPVAFTSRSDAPGHQCIAAARSTSDRHRARWTRVSIAPHGKGQADTDRLETSPEAAGPARRFEETGPASQRSGSAGPASHVFPPRRIRFCARYFALSAVRELSLLPRRQRTARSRLGTRADRIRNVTDESTVASSFPTCGRAPARCSSTGLPVPVLRRIPRPG
jgi:hypothetical protein